AVGMPDKGVGNREVVHRAVLGRQPFEGVGDAMEQRRELRVELCGAGHDRGGRYHTDASSENRGKCVILPAIALFLTIAYQCAAALMPAAAAILACRG